MVGLTLRKVEHLTAIRYTITMPHALFCSIPNCLKVGTTVATKLFAHGYAR